MLTKKKEIQDSMTEINGQHIKVGWIKDSNISQDSISRIKKRKIPEEQREHDEHEEDRSRDGEEHVKEEAPHTTDEMTDDIRHTKPSHSATDTSLHKSIKYKNQ